MPSEARVAVVLCAYCRREITTVHISCASPACGSVDLCVECFAGGAQGGEVPTHSCVPRQACAALRARDNAPVLPYAA